MDDVGLLKAARGKGRMSFLVFEWPVAEWFQP